MARVTRTEDEKQALLAAWHRSGVSLYRFARKNHLSPKTLRAWAAEGPPAFLPASVVEEEAPSTSTLVVELAGVGHRIHVPADFEAASLRRLLEVLC